MNESIKNRLVDLMVESSPARRKLTRGIAANIAGVTPPRPYNAPPSSRDLKHYPKKGPWFGKPFDHPTGNADMQKKLAALKPSTALTTTTPTSTALTTTTPTSKANTLPALPNVRSRRRSGAELENSPYGNATDAEFTVKGDSNPAGSPVGNSRAPLRLTTGARRAGETGGYDFWKERQKNIDAANNISDIYRAGRKVARGVLPNNTNPTPKKSVF
jgi:hypothetical protein